MLKKEKPEINTKGIMIDEIRKGVWNERNIIIIRNKKGNTSKE